MVQARATGWLSPSLGAMSRDSLRKPRNDRLPKLKNLLGQSSRKLMFEKCEIAINVVSWPSGKGRKYSAWHNLPTTDPEKAQNSKYMQLFEVGQILHFG